MDAAPADLHDRYFCRVLAQAPDPMLTGQFEIENEPAERPMLSLNPELIRVIVPEQSADDSGLDAMQELIPSPSTVHFLVPLAPELDEASLDLFGFFTYELRVGHNDSRWSTAQGRFGPRLRITGVQHPPPPLICQVSRSKDLIRVSAPFATPVLEGKMVRPFTPRSDMWVLLYAQVQQMDGDGWRNVLLLQSRADPIAGDRHRRRPQSALEFAAGTFNQGELGEAMGFLGLAPNGPLSVLAVELIPEIDLNQPQGSAPRRDPLRESLGDVRILRTSPLFPVPARC